MVDFIYFISSTHVLPNIIVIDTTILKLSLLDIADVRQNWINHSGQNKMKLIYVVLFLNPTLD